MTFPHTLSRPDLLKEAAFIDGQWIEATAKIAVTNPADGSALGTVPNLGADETIQAVAAAWRAQVDWRKLAAKARGAILRRWGELMPIG